MRILAVAALVLVAGCASLQNKDVRCQGYKTALANLEAIEREFPGQNDARKERIKLYRVLIETNCGGT